MSKINVARITWVVSLFLLLIVILLMVMDYKINYQYANMKKLYFYDCDGNICTSEVKDDNKNYISIYDCDDTCPVFKKVIFDNYILLVKDNLQILYNYTDGLVIGNQYDEYEFVGNDYIKVGKSNHYGIIDLDGKVMINLEYDDIGFKIDDVLVGYTNDLVVAKLKDKYGVINYKSGEVVEKFNYTLDEVKNLINK